MTRITLEVCCGTASDVFEAEKAGADRVELNSCLSSGGLTPSIGELTVAKETGIEIMAMVRPREGGFCYSETDFRCALEDAKNLLKQGADGIVFGFLKPDGSIDEERCKIMLEAIGDYQSVFNRAFDVVPDWKEGMDTLCGLGVTRILTSGQHSSVLDGSKTVKEMIHYAAGRIQILPGAGIRLNNVCDIIKETGCTQIHASMQSRFTDRSTGHHSFIHFSRSGHTREDTYGMTDYDKVKALKQLLNQQSYMN